jgi:CO/xanthine dehydrogenase FAD-binding subunit
MFTAIDLVQPETLEEAYSVLISKKNNTVLGGCAFLRMGSKRIGTAVELSKVDLDYIREDGDYIEIGASTSLRELEKDSLVKSYFNGVLGKAVGDIIGVQFRNVVTIGATVFSKYGFSDLITALLALDTEVELYKGGRMSLEVFLKRPYEKDILTRLFIKKSDSKAVYTCLRNSSTDYPVLNVTVSNLKNNWKIVVGARPAGASIAVKASELLSNGHHIGVDLVEKAAQLASEELNFGTNMRGTAEYRKAICKALIKRAVMEVSECK